VSSRNERGLGMTARTLFVSDLDGTLLGPGAALSEVSRGALRGMIVGRHAVHGGDGAVDAIDPAAAGGCRAAAAGDRAQRGVRVGPGRPGGTWLVQALAADVAAAVMARDPAAGPGRVHRDDGGRRGSPVPRRAAETRGWRGIATRSSRWGTRGCARWRTRRWRWASEWSGFTLFAEREVVGELAAELRGELAERVQLHGFENFYCPGWWELSIHDRSATKAERDRRAAPVARSGRIAAGGVRRRINDLDMFAHADHAVAVENAVPELRAVASEIAGRHDEDGVVRWLTAALAAQRG